MNATNTLVFFFGLLVLGYSAIYWGFERLKKLEKWRRDVTFVTPPSQAEKEKQRLANATINCPVCHHMFGYHKAEGCSKCECRLEPPPAGGRVIGS